jgi:hypothetical protein
MRRALSSDSHGAICVACMQSSSVSKQHPTLPPHPNVQVASPSGNASRLTPHRASTRCMEPCSPLRAVVTELPKWVKFATEGAALLTCWSASRLGTDSGQQTGVNMGLQLHHCTALARHRSVQVSPLRVPCHYGVDMPCCLPASSTAVRTICAMQSPFHCHVTSIWVCPLFECSKCRSHSCNKDTLTNTLVQ